ncbi:response regulator transcription factor [Variovorax sp. UC74_104]|uniref:response regulator transcription factor n=1 Tax=Variovorax sp. UC74_104 TaxID=3374555 RepID=UPI003757872B
MRHCRERCSPSISIATSTTAASKKPMYSGCWAWRPSSRGRTATRSSRTWHRRTQACAGSKIERALQRTAPLLSPRERAVCARIACGIGIDGIAAELCIAASTVATLRKRAYAKLAIHGRQQLLRFIH